MIVDVVSTVGQHSTGAQATVGVRKWGAERQLHRFSSQHADAGLVPKEMTKLATNDIRKNRIRFRFMALFG